MDKAIESVRSTLIEVASASASESEEVRLWVKNQFWGLDPDHLRAFLDATKPPEPKPSEVLDKLAEGMIEARRYCRSNPEHAAAEIGKFIPRIADAMCGVVGRDARLVNNLRVGTACIVSDPEVLESYLYAAASEVRSLADAKRKEAES